ncbi:axoneme-associated protein mst101(2)-like, partial [Temnothorax curvispinosus]|uniref:Axoneme-associated protein mst101(2)-like n=1 Tax=Temnothorax curvispinosus TaxID=300111 RepID=A0A6J1PDN1_9HYME
MDARGATQDTGQHRVLELHDDKRLIKKKVPTCVTVKYATRAERLKEKKREDLKKKSNENLKTKEMTFAKQSDIKFKKREEIKLEEREETKSENQEKTRAEDREETKSQKQEETKLENREETKSEKVEEANSAECEETKSEQIEEAKSEECEETNTSREKPVRKAIPAFFVRLSKTSMYTTASASIFEYGTTRDGHRDHSVPADVYTDAPSEKVDVNYVVTL